MIRPSTPETGVRLRRLHSPGGRIASPARLPRSKPLQSWISRLRQAHDAGRARHQPNHGKPKPGFLLPSTRAQRTRRRHMLQEPAVYHPQVRLAFIVSSDLSVFSKSFPTRQPHMIFDMIRLQRNHTPVHPVHRLMHRDRLRPPELKLHAYDGSTMGVHFANSLPLHLDRLICLH